MSYAIIQPPCSFQFAEMPSEELKRYRAWFHEITPKRIAELAKAVNGTTGFEEWEADELLDSLDGLGEWFATQVTTRRRTDEETDEIKLDLLYPIEVPDEELSNRTFSLAVDIGMYFGRVVLRNVPGTRWEQPMENKNFADYGQPVIVGRGTVPLNPIRVLVTTAYRISSRRPAQLRELYEVWSKMLKLNG